MNKACFLALVCSALPLQAAERVLDFHSEIRIARDGSLSVTEIVTVQAEGGPLRSGMVRELPFGLLEYRVAYRAERRIAFGQERDQLAWTVNAGWALPIERMSAEVRFAEPVPAGEIKVDARTGPAESPARDYQAFVRQGSAAFRITRPLGPQESFSILVAFPKGVVDPPTRTERFDAWLQSNPVVLVLLGGGLLLALWRTRYRGQVRNPGPGS